ncbi:MAG: hypothetical protein NTZ44_02625 [Candidatus Nomurabacteria bacterium]|nr:hypothetical protein [Candidatus Nomurabacteria bacterium]
MKKIWIFILITLFIQEPASTDAAIFQIRTLHINIFLINFIWIIATVFDIWFGYKVGKFVQKKFKDTRFELWSFRWAGRIENFIGQKGKKFVLILLGIINFPYANSFLASWLTLSFKDIFTYLFIGDVLYWAIEWGINIGVRSFVIDPHLALYIVIGAGLLLLVISKIILSKVLKNKN